MVQVFDFLLVTQFKPINDYRFYNATDQYQAFIVLNSFAKEHEYFSNNK